MLTEHGVAELRDRSLRARAKIAIADTSIGDERAAGAPEVGHL